MATFQGIGLQLPFTTERAFTVARVDQECGRQYGYYYSAASTASWVLSFPALTSAEADTLQAHFESVAGGWDTFSFTDPDTAVVYSACRYTDPSLTRTYNADGTVSVTLKITEVK